MKLFTKSNYQRIIEIILILVIAGLAYLPNITRASIYRDDWYYAMDRTIGGPGIFQEMFSIDRPARGPLFEAYYQLFDIQPIFYHLSSFIWRVLGGFAALYLFNLLWPGKKRVALFMALAFMLFPGYSRWLEGFENQPRIISSFLEVISIALTLQAINTKRMAPKIVAWIGSILTGWAYIAFVDFAIGMEFFRLLCVFIVISHAIPKKSILQKSVQTLRAWAVAALIPVLFLIWRLFIFHNQRPTTDVGLQLSYLIKSPLHTGLTWLIHLFQSSINIALLAWAMPTSQTLFNYGVSEIIWGFIVASLAVGCLLAAEFFLNKKVDAVQVRNSNPTDHWQIEAILIGLAGVIVGVVPVIMANRYATLGNYSHYALPSSLASAALLGGLVFSILSNRIRLGVISILVLFAVLTHYSISLRITQEETTVSNFWQQVVWRAPGIKAGTTLVVNYPSIDFGQDIDTVAGPANYLYFPQLTKQIPATYQLSALEQGENSSKDVLNNPGKSFVFRYRTHKSDVNYDNLLVMTQPTSDSCVHILNPTWLQISNADPYPISSVAALSKIDRVLTSATPPVPNKSIFGPEPKHEWCFYYEKADLALQNGDFNTIASLGDEIFKQDLHPGDAIEWLPFVQAYALSGNIPAIDKMGKSFKQEPYYSKQVCQILKSMNSGQYPLPSATLDEINRVFCTQ